MIAVKKKNKSCKLQRAYPRGCGDMRSLRSYRERRFELATCWQSVRNFEEYKARRFGLAVWREVR